MNKVIFVASFLCVSFFSHGQTKISKFNLSEAAVSIFGWTNVYGNPANSVPTATDAITGFGFRSTGTSNWNTSFGNDNAQNAYGETVDDGGGFAMPSGVVANLWFNYSSVFSTGVYQTQIFGLDPAKTYTIVLLGSRGTAGGATAPRATDYNIKGLTTLTKQTLNNWRNTSQTVTFSNVQPDASGFINIAINRKSDGTGGSFGYLNGLIVTEDFTGNQSPIANAGADQAITLPTNSVTVNGSGSDPDGTIALYAWTKISGGTANITSASSASTTITDLVQGTYVFRLTVTDNGGVTGSDDVQITVNAASNQPPSVNAGIDQTLTLPTNSVQLNGSATDADGSVASRTWSKISGPTSFTFSSTSILNPTVSNLVQGTYTFRLTATDNLGASNSDDIVVTVVSGSSTWTVSGNATSANDFIGTTNAADLIFKTNNIQQAKITSTGEFWARKIKVTQSGWADYVFDSTYHLRPIAEVKSYIRKYKHLPDVPSALQVKEEGLNLGDGQAILLRKIEELTLYIINQQEELKKQAAQIKELQKKLESKNK